MPAIRAHGALPQELVERTGTPAGTPYIANLSNPTSLAHSLPSKKYFS
jgi:hypothetical protein